MARSAALVEIRSLRGLGEPQLGFLVGLLTALFLWPAPAVAQPRNCSQTFVRLTPLTDLGQGTYQGALGGLYPEGSNEVPQEHLALGLELASLVEPLDTDGHPSPTGSIVLMSVGVSSTRIDFDAFMALVSEDPAVNDSLVLVNGAQDQRPISDWVDPNHETWRLVLREFRQADVTPAQVQVAWIQLPARGPTGSFPTWAQSYAEDLADVVRNLTIHYPNIRLAYLSSRPYGGYASHNNPEPYSYEYGFGVKWTIEEQILNPLGSDLNADPALGPVDTPWIAWGPYLWTDGLGLDGEVGGVAGRSDGLEWTCEDVEESDGIHPTEQGARKTAEMLYEHLASSPSARIWFLESEADDGQPSTSTSISTSTSQTSPPTTFSTTSSTEQGEGGQPQSDDRGEAGSTPNGDEPGGLDRIVWVGLAALAGGVVGAGVVKVVAGRR